MRIPMIVATAMLLTAGASAASAAPTMDVPYLVASAVQDPAPPAQPTGGDVKVDINLGSDGATVWYTDPMWIVLGVAAVIVVVALIAMASRGGGGTTVIR